MLASAVGPILLAAAWLTAFFLIIDVRHYKISYIIAGIAAGLLLWKEFDHLVPAHTVGQTITAGIFLASLTVATVSDLYEMMVPRFCSIWLVPFWTLFAYFGLIPLTPHEVAIGAFLGYAIPWTIAWAFRQLTGKNGMGEGDMEFLAMIGSYVGTCSVITSLYLGTVLALVIGLPYLYFIKKNLRGKLPFAPALALGALLSFHLCLL